jgi:hypothetical protein
VYAFGLSVALLLGTDRLLDRCITSLVYVGSVCMEILRDASLGVLVSENGSILCSKILPKCIGQYATIQEFFKGKNKAITRQSLIQVELRHAMIAVVKSLAASDSVQRSRPVACF